MDMNMQYLLSIQTEMMPQKLGRRECCVATRRPHSNATLKMVPVFIKDLGMIVAAPPFADSTVPTFVGIESIGSDCIAIGNWRG